MSTNDTKKHKPLVGVPSEEVQAERREKIFTSGKRRNQGVINLRDTADNNYMKVVKDQHERRKLLEQESKRGLPKDAMIWDEKRALSAMKAFKDDVDIQKRRIKKE